MIKKIENKQTKTSTAYEALKEAQARNKNKKKLILPKELGGRDGPEPTRFGDWEKKGIISDF